MTTGVLVLATLAAVAAALAATARARVAARLGRSDGHAPLPLLAPPAAVASRLADTALPLDPSLAWSAWLAVAVLAPVAGWAVGGPGGVVLAVAVVGGGPAGAWWALRGRADRLVDAALAPFLEHVARALRSGASLHQAVDEAGRAAGGRLAQDVAALTSAAARGMPLAEAAARWAERRPRPGVRLCAAAVSLAAETGGPQAAAFDGVAATLRQRHATEAEAAALGTQARLSGWLIALAPVAFGALSAGADPRTAHFLLRTPAGLAVLLAGLALDAAGALWMARLTRLPS